MNTIFAPATIIGKSGVAVIRVSGSDAKECLKAFGILPEIKPRIVNFVKLMDVNNNEIIDEALLIYFDGPKSFTGEDVIELQLHGSKAVINIVLDTLAKLNNFRLAEPGEFARRAFMNGKMDLTRAEGLSDLIEAETKMQHKQAIRQVSGELERHYEAWRRGLIKIMGLVEAFIDFPDEDIPEDIVVEVENFTKDLARKIELELVNNRGERIKEGFYVTILGAPNVGKSTLINYLAAKDIAITSDIAGTTRDIIETHLDLGGYPVIIADTAGLRETADVIEDIGVKKAIQRASHSDLKLIVLDADNLTDPHSVAQIDIDSIVIINKIDKIKQDLPKLSFEYIAISVKENIGLEALISKIRQFAESYFYAGASPMITRKRHRVALEKCLACLKEFTLSKPIELAAEDLRAASIFLGQITGRIDVETILGEIFANFCIGK